jgi:hypothetical protein
MSTVIPKELSERVFDVASEEATTAWIREVDRAMGGMDWRPLGGIENNVHTVEVASDPALALVERPTNSIDQLLDLKARELDDTAPTPHAAAEKWWSVPASGLAALDDRARRELADHVRVEMVESDTFERPTIVIRDRGTGQHPDDFKDTLLSLLASNKKSKTHVMGVYNAGGAASYKFCKYAIVISRLAPQLLDGREDEVGVSVVRYNPLDPNKFKSGVYEYMTAKDGSILRLDLAELPEMPYGAYVKLIEYLLPKYARAAYEPKNSLWHLFHAALPNPALPFRIIETRAKRFSGMKTDVERRVVSGLLYLLSIKDVADYSDVRPIDLGPAVGTVVLRYFVLNEGRDPDYYTTSDQGLTVTLNGQRQMTKDRLWLRRNLELFFLYKRLLVFVDCTGLTNAAKREVFASTRETGVDTPLGKLILDRVLQELADDENLYSFEEAARQQALQSATETTTEKVKKRLATQISSYLSGDIGGTKGGGTKTKRRRRRRPDFPPPSPDDSLMLEIPDKLAILTDPLKIERGATAALRLEINAKNDFLPKYADCLSVVFPDLKEHVKVRSKGRLVGGKVRITVEADSEAPTTTSPVKVALIVPDLGVLLTAEGTVEVTEPQTEKEKDNKTGGQPNVQIVWYQRKDWERFNWDSESVGECEIHREDLSQPTAITRVVWHFNEAFSAYESVMEGKKMGEAALKIFRENYEYPVAFGLFKQRLAEDAKESQADDEGRQYDVPDDYVKEEKARLARAVLMAMEPEVQLAEATEVAGAA